uniref:Uncharacterized protein n=1 Tax=Arundo donax TaxID=35708 RepID=A0A0A8YFB7_ARUDO
MDPFALLFFILPMGPTCLLLSPFSILAVGLLVISLVLLTLPFSHSVRRGAHSRVAPRCRHRHWRHHGQHPRGLQPPVQRRRGGGDESLAAPSTQARLSALGTGVAMTRTMGDIHHGCSRAQPGRRWSRETAWSTAAAMVVATF